MIDEGIVKEAFPQLLKYASCYGGLQLVQAVLVFTFIYLAGILGERIQYDLRKALFNHLQDLSLSYYSQNAVGRLMARVTSDTGRVSKLDDLGYAGCDLGDCQHHLLDGLHADHQLETGV